MSFVPPPAAVPVSPAPPAFAPKAAFLLGADMFELLYGDACTAAVGDGLLLGGRPYLPAGDWPAELAAAEIVFTGWGGPRFDAALLARLPKLRTVFLAGGTVRPHVTEAFWDRGIAITTAAAANAIPVAEYTLAAILLALKRAWALDRETRQARAFPRTWPAPPGALGSTVGLVSLGLIGRLVLERLRSFDLRVIAYDPHVAPEEFARLGATPVSLEELMATSDVVSVHSPLNPATEGMISGRLLRTMKSGSTFINTARGAVVREDEMVEVLRERPDLQAILDVTAVEPPPAESPLFDLPNVFLTPHIAGSLGPECRRLGAAMMDEYRRFRRGEPLQHLVTREQAEFRT